MTLRIVLFVLIMLVQFAVAHGRGADSPTVPTLPSIRFPDLPTPSPAPPSPPADPAIAVKLLAGQRYVIESTGPIEVRAWPRGLVKVIRKKGPVDVIGDLVGYTDGPTGHTFAGPYVVVIQPIGKGTVTISVRPPNAASESDDVDRVLDLGTSDPPGPLPGPAPPLDPLAATLQAAYTAAPDPTAARSLAALYRAAAADGGTVDDKILKTTADLFTDVSKAAGQVVPLPKLQAVRTAIAAELVAQLGAAATPLTPDLRAKARVQFLRFAAILEALK